MDARATSAPPHRPATTSCARRLTSRRRVALRLGSPDVGSPYALTTSPPLPTRPYVNPEFFVRTATEDGRTVPRQLGGDGKIAPHP